MCRQQVVRRSANDQAPPFQLARRCGCRQAVPHQLGVDPNQGARLLRRRTQHLLRPAVQAAHLKARLQSKGQGRVSARAAWRSRTGPGGPQAGQCGVGPGEVGVFLYLNRIHSPKALF